MATNPGHWPGICVPICHSKQNLYRQLGDAWVAGLPRAEGAERRIVVEFVEGADLICTVHGSRADDFRSEVGMVENVEVLPAELNPQAFGHDEILGKLYIPIRGLGQTIRVFADVAEGAEDSLTIRLRESTA